MIRLIFANIFIIFVYILLCVCSEKLVIDTDGGADDAASIILAISAWRKNDSNFEIVAITCVSGNAEEEQVEKNILKTLTIVNEKNIPIYRGAHKPLIGNRTADNYFGNDGLGDFLFEYDVNIKVNRSTYASVALINFAKKYPHKLSVLCLGPLTNIAIAASLDRRFMSLIKRFYIMGGSVLGIGNKSPGVEFNFASDPESNFIVLNHEIPRPSLLCPWEAVLKAAIPKIWRKYRLGAINSRIMRFLNKAEAKSLNDDLDIWATADLLTTGVMIWPHFAKKTFITNVSPVIDGLARGGLLVDYSNKSGKQKNVEIVQEIDIESFQMKLINYFS